MQPLPAFTLKGATLHEIDHQQGPVIIVGGGFSGTMVALQLARRGIASQLIAPSREIARGVAYSTGSSHHLLNVRAGNMSAFPDKPGDFADYIAPTGGHPDSFATRKDYGDYLETQLKAGVAEGLVKLVHGPAVSARRTSRGWMVRLTDGDNVFGGTLVLALGNAAPALAFSDTVEAGDLIDLFWTPHSWSRVARAGATDEPVLIIGTGLTMVDALLSLDASGHKGPVTAVSRHGLVPLPHIAPAATSLSPPQLDDVPEGLSEFIRWLRQRGSMETAWQLAIDALRPITQGVWGRMDHATRRRFLRHARTYWDVHRHRMAPELHQWVEERRAQGQLSIVAGRLNQVIRRSDGYLVGIAPRGGRETVEVEAGLIINCTGPRCSIRGSADPLIRQMVTDKLMQPDELDLGVQIDDADRLAGFEDAYAIGTITRGRYWEITSVPDLRVKAAEIASSISTAMAPRCLEQV